jgi:hypothetical protein
VYCHYTVLVGPKFLRSIKRSEEFLRNKTLMFLRFKSPSLHYYDADPSDHCLRRGSAAALLLGMGIRISQMAWCLLWVFVCFQRQVSASGWSPVHRSPTECGVSECNREVSKRRRPYSARGCCGVENILWHKQKTGSVMLSCTVRSKGC